MAKFWQGLNQRIGQKLGRVLSVSAWAICAAAPQLSSAAGAAGPQPVAAPLGIELIVRTVNNFSTHDDVANFFERAKNANVSAVHVNVKQDEDDERPSGEVYYASAIAPIAAGYEHFDALAASIEQAQQRGIKIYAWLPQFHDQAAMRAHPEWQMIAKVNGASEAFQGNNNLEYFVNPIHPAVQAYQLSVIAEVVKNYPVDGVSLDWLRFDDVNMDVGPYTQQLAQTEIGLDPMLLDFSTPSAALERWEAWRAEKISAYVRDVRQTIQAIRPSVRLGAFVLPPDFTEVGQDVALLSKVLDEVLPMAYFKDWNFPASWVNTNVMAGLERKRTPNTVIKPTLDGTGTFEDNVQILADIQHDYQEVSAIAWFSAVYWEPEQIKRIVKIHQAAAVKQ